MSPETGSSGGARTGDDLSVRPENGPDVRELSPVVQVHRPTHDELLQVVQHPGVREELEGEPVVLGVL